jgi:hypothetical protein
MDSYFGSSEGTLQEDLTSGTAELASSLHERLQRAKAKVGGAWERKSPARSPSAARDISKAGRYTPYKKLINPEALAKFIQRRQKRETGFRLTGTKELGCEDQDGGDVATLNLVGAHGQPRQEQ